MERSGVSDRVCLVGAYERHNFGDWLLAWCAQRLLEPAHDVAWMNVLERIGVGMDASSAPFLPISEAVQPPWAGVPVLHPGGETLGCGVSSAVDMSFPPGPQTPAELAASLGLGRDLAYVTPDRELIRGEPVDWGPRAFFGVGGREVPQLDEARQARLASALRSARWTSVRDSVTAEVLGRLGIDAVVHPDLVSAVPALFEPGPASGSDAGGIVMQLSSAAQPDFAAGVVDALAPLADRFPHLEVGVAGIAPRHDRFVEAADLVVGFEHAGVGGWARLRLEVHPLEIVRRIAHAGLVVATSLHYRILAMAFGVPAITVGVAKTISYAREWDLVEAGAPGPDDLGAAVGQALEPATAERLRHADHLAALTLAHWNDAQEALLAS